MEIPRHWRLNEQRYRLIGDTDELGNPRFPPRKGQVQIHQESIQKPQLRVDRGAQIIISSSMEASMSSK